MVLANAVVTTLLLVAAVLAGCAGSDPTSSGPDGPEIDPPVRPTDDTGIIRGVVVDEAVRPIPGVTVSVILPDGAPKQTTTDETGVFGFDGLAPGDYFVTAEKAGYTKAQQSTTVVAAEAKPPAVRILLAADPETRPYAQTQTFTGFIECSLRVRDATGATSVVFGEPFYYGSNTGCNELENQATNFEVPFDRSPTWVQGELTWESTQSTGSGLTLVVGPRTCEDVKWGRADGQSPLVATMNATVVAENEAAEADQAACFRVFTWSAPETLDFFGASVSQEFQLVVTAFYGFEPQPGWTFGAQGDPQPPA